MDETKLVIEEVRDHAEIARHKAWRERCARNLHWLDTRWGDLLPQARGQFVVVAGQEGFVADSAEAAWAWAKTAHPDDDAAYVQFVFDTEGPRIYGNRRPLVALR